MIENIKNCWSSACFRNSDPENPDNRRLTALQSLARRYRRFSNLALIFLFCMPFVLINLFWNHDYGEDWMRISIVILSIVYFATCSIMDRWLYNGIRSIDVCGMCVSEVCRLALFYRKRHLQFVVILIPMAVILIGSIAWVLSDNIYSIYGVVCGSLFGLIIGTRQLHAFLNSYKSITRE